jgi:disulfide oxidoreductase YuzD
MSVKMVDAPKIRNESKFQVFMANTVIQADLIYMCEDNGYNFILDVVDVGSRACDAEPLEGRTAKDVIEGFECIFKRDYIKPPFRYLYTDPGSEFNNEEFHEHMKDYKIIVRHTMTNRKNQMGVVEYYNHILTKVLGTKMTAHEIEHDEPNSDWAESLPKIIDELNNNKREQKISDFFKFQIFKKGESKNMLKVGDYVHVRMQQPKDVISGKRLHGNFRNGDQRFEKKVSRITFVSMRPNQPVRYMVNDANNVSFLRSELLLADENEANEENTKIEKDNTERKQREDAEEDERKNFKGLNVMKLRNRYVYMID